MLIDKHFSRVLVIIQLLTLNQPTIDYESWLINSWQQIRFGTWQMKSTSPSQSGVLFPTSSQYVENSGGKILKRTKKLAKKLFFPPKEHEVKKHGDRLGDCCDSGKSCERECERPGVQQAKRRRSPNMRVDNLWVRSRRSRELERTCLRNQTVHGDDEEDGSGDGGDRTVSHSKRRQTHSFYFTTGSVKRTRIESKEDFTQTWTSRSGL
jgi:hypothetical protein